MDVPLIELEQDYEKAVEPWRGRLEILPQADYRARIAICEGCKWRSVMWNGVGCCEHPKLNCRKHKPWLAGNVCKQGLWPVTKIDSKL